MAREKPLTPERVEELRAILRDGKRWEIGEAMHEAALAEGGAESLVPDIATFLSSDDYLRVSEQKYSFSGITPLAFAAMSSIESIGVAPEVVTLRKLLDDRRVFLLPEASYDQGAYIGDYSSQAIAPAQVAARLVPLLKADGFKLLPELLFNARNDEKEIWQPAILATKRLLPFLANAADHERELLAALSMGFSVSPKIAKPATARDFELRDLAALCQKKLAALAGQ